MKLNQKFFGQEHFERGTPGRDFCNRLGILRPPMGQYGFALRDQIPELPSDRGGVLQVKYNGMLTVIIWDHEKQKFVGWSPRGRCYFSLGENRIHPITEYFSENLSKHKKIAFIGETYVVREIENKAYMTEFNKSMSIIKNPTSLDDVERLRLAVFDSAKIKTDGEFDQSISYMKRFNDLSQKYHIPIGCDSGKVHVPNFLRIENSLEQGHSNAQAFWDEFIGERGFEGLVMHLEGGGIFKIKYRDTLDVAIIAFRMRGKKRPVCEKCGIKFDVFWLRKHARDGLIKRDEWLTEKGQLRQGHGPYDMWGKWTDSCPVCKGPIRMTAGPIFGAKMALMTKEGLFIDIADGAQIPAGSPILELIEPLYEEEDYLWVKPEVVIEISYQDLYVDRLRPLYKFEKNRYWKSGEINAVSLRPYKIVLREDKTVNLKDLRLEQLSHFVGRTKRIQEKWEDEKKTLDTTLED